MMIWGSTSKESLVESGLFFFPLCRSRNQRGGIVQPPLAPPSPHFAATMNAAGRALNSLHKAFITDPAEIDDVAGLCWTCDRAIRAIQRRIESAPKPAPEPASRPVGQLI